MAEPIRLFAGYDRREAIGFAVFCHSVIRRASQPVSIVPLASMGLPEGSNNFTLSRFLVPWLCGFEGTAIFCDASDMLMLGNIADLAALADPQYAVQVVKHDDYTTRHKTKYRGTSMECPNTNYSRKNWASVMVINCAHSAWAGLTPEAIRLMNPLSLLQFRTLGLISGSVGEINSEWNCLVDEGQSGKDGKILHWTAGIPAFDAYRDAPYAELWHHERRDMERVG